MPHQTLSTRNDYERKTNYDSPKLKRNTVSEKWRWNTYVKLQAFSL